MSASQLMSRTPKRAYIIAPSVKQKEEILKSIDRYCSLYYISDGFCIQHCPNSDDRRLQRN